jgi:hypothetical protein
MKENAMRSPIQRATLVAGAAVVLLVSAAAVLIPAAAQTTTRGTSASVVRPSIASVTFSGTSGSGVASPKITIKGAHFGTAPNGTSNNRTSCGHYTANGRVYASKLYFLDDKNFEAGFSNSSGADCIGIRIVSWSRTKVILKFGNAYGTFDHWFLTNGDGFALSIKSALWGNTVSGLN